MTTSLSALTSAVGRQYDRFQATLEQLGKDRKFLNYGYGAAASYEEAQEQLCREVFQAGDIKAGDRIVDVGFGSGEQDFVLAREFEFHCLNGFNVSARQVTFANERAHRERLDRKLAFHHGEAERLDGVKNGSIDKLFAVECAFYFDRARFYRRAAEVLKPGGVVVLADISFSEALAFLTRRGENFRRVGTRSGNRSAWEQHLETRSVRSINRFTAPGAQLTVWKILRIAPLSGCSAAEMWQWFKMALSSQMVAVGLWTGLIHYDMIVLERPGAERRNQSR
jgi:SAM-dependent methyltransferase